MQYAIRVDETANRGDIGCEQEGAKDRTLGNPTSDWLIRRVTVPHGDRLAATGKV